MVFTIWCKYKVFWLGFDLSFHF